MKLSYRVLLASFSLFFSPVYSNDIYDDLDSIEDYVCQNSCLFNKKEEEEKCYLCKQEVQAMRFLGWNVENHIFSEIAII